jgi:hypothetical protein
LKPSCFSSSRSSSSLGCNKVLKTLYSRLFIMLVPDPNKYRLKPNAFKGLI